MSEAPSESVSIKALLQEIREDAAHIFEKKSPSILARLREELPPNLPPIDGDEQLLRTLLWSLIATGSINATEDSFITIEAEQSTSTLDVSVRFQPNPMFVLVTQNTSDVGLKKIGDASLEKSGSQYIAYLRVRTLAEMLGGNVWVELPRQQTAVLHVFVPRIRNRKVSADTQPKTLVIEDNRQIGMLLELYFKHERYQTAAAVNGSEGYELAKDFQPDLITLDVMMPEMDGWQTLKAIKSDEHTRDIPIIVISVLRDVQVGFEFGASDYITKPVDREDLLVAARRLMGLEFGGTSKRPEAVNRVLLSSLQHQALASTLQAILPDAEIIECNIEANGQQIFSNSDDTIALFDLRSPEHAAVMATRLQLHPATKNIPCIGISIDTPVEVAKKHLGAAFDQILNEDQLPEFFL